jgi:hypothetical protein
MILCDSTLSAMRLRKGWGTQQGYNFIRQRSGSIVLGEMARVVSGFPQHRRRNRYRLEQNQSYSVLPDDLEGRRSLMVASI